MILGSTEPVSTQEINYALGIRPQAEGELPFPGFDLPLREAREKFEKAYLEYQLHTLHGSVSKVAERVGIERTHLYRKLRSLGIDPKQIKELTGE
jgi:two-component system, NtrC family, nitrogen regulation response regulator NtrX